MVLFVGAFRFVWVLFGNILWFFIKNYGGLSV